ncbi:septum formation family protein [Catelliglobosispora koreensis]|uniref:septum formation family protein n=1 Tax=Catelliglobosispora koreensis TaxID=129052 RepID=UPI00035C0AF3|nr:septum formation family protein [Catelliglobosispora koreensis]
MRRAFLAALIAGATLVTASACGVPPGTDGDLSNQWPAMPAAAGWEPKAGSCSQDFSANLFRSGYNPVECTAAHKFETVHIGQFTGDAARGGIPASNSDTMKAAWSECDKKTTEFLGGNWRDGRIWIGVSLPSRGNWDGGAKWYRCEAGIYEDLFSSSMTSRNKSLKGEFSGASDLKYGCLNVPKAEDQEIQPVDCGTGHNAEYVGSFAVDLSWDDVHKDKGPDSVHNSCRATIASYVGVPNDNNLKYRTGTYYFTASKRDWDAGDRSIRCHLYVGKTLTKSLKGTGTGGLPINYA